MLRTSLATAVLAMICVSVCNAQEEQTSDPVELELIKQSIGVWDADIEVWPQGIDKPSIKFSGVETNRAFGKYWLASDFDSEFMGQVSRLHSIVGYDADQEKLVGTVIDQGTYSASMVGEYDADEKKVHWVTNAKDFDGTPMVQNSVITQNSPTERTLELSMATGESSEFVKFMVIKFKKRESDSETQNKD